MELVEDEPVNTVTLVGRLSLAPEERVLPSGDRLWTFRVVVPRPAGGRGRAGQVDALDCAVWGGSVRRSMRRWREGDLVQVTGSVRRRFFRTPSGAASRVEVEVSAGRLLRRAATA